MPRKPPAPESVLASLWSHHHAELRDPHQIVCQWKQASDVDPQLLEHRVRGRWWETLDELGITLLVTREYEHLVMAFCVRDGRRRTSYLHLPHPNGLAVDPVRARVHLASTRNPNMVFEFAPCAGLLPNGRATDDRDQNGLLLPVRSRFLPGSLYLHDLALIGGELYANAVGMNAVVHLPEGQGFAPVWWPRCIDSPVGPRFDKNYLQLNSIAAGPSLAASFFTASAAAPSRRRPGHLNFPVDRRGVVFAGVTRDVVGTGLTRPHSARLFRGEVWVANSGYGELGRIAAGRFEPIFRLSGWTRGLCFCGTVAFVGTSRVIPRFRHYAPGLTDDESECGVHALDLVRGTVLGSLLWPAGNQIFALETLDRRLTHGFPFTPQAARGAKGRILLFARGLPRLPAARAGNTRPRPTS